MTHPAVELENFVKLHANRLPKPNGCRRVFLVHHSSRGVALNVDLEEYSVQDVQNKFDTSRPPVAFLLHQMHTYDPYAFNILGLIFDAETIFAHVVSQGCREN